MKVLACVLLCVVVAVQGRSSGVDKSRSYLAAPGSNPWLVHLRLATSTSGYLRTCTGSLIHNSWVLTTAECTKDLRFAWIRYGTVNVISPSLVTESSTVTIHPQYNPTTGNHNLAIIAVNRFIQANDMMAPVPLATEPRDLPRNATFCGYGADYNGEAGEELKCFGVELESDGNQIVATSWDGDSTEFDSGAPMVVNGVQVGILSGYSETGKTTFTKTQEYIPWIVTVTGVEM